MAKLFKISNWEPGRPDYYFNCPGCKCDHGIWIKKTPKNECVWNFNGDIDKPTFSPSILVRYPVKDKMHVCHSFITDGYIRFLDDCTHELAGQTVELEDIND